MFCIKSADQGYHLGFAAVAGFGIFAQLAISQFQQQNQTLGDLLAVSAILVFAFYLYMYGKTKRIVRKPKIFKNVWFGWSFIGVMVNSLAFLGIFFSP